MNITIAVVLCLATATAGSPKCVERIANPNAQSLMECANQAALAKWKSESPLYSGDEWRIARVKCVPGNYQPDRRI